MVIYLTTNLVNGERYIGKDSNNNPKYLGSGVLLKEDIKIYGKEKFKKEILEYCKTDEELTLQESYWIQHYNALLSDNFYNLVDFNSGWNINKLGAEKYKILLEKISKNSTGIPRIFSNPELRNKKISESTKGKLKPEGFGDMVSKGKLGKKFSKEHCKNITKGKLGKKQPQSFLDKKYKPIIQLDKENNILHQYKSIEEACNINPQFKRSNISCCLIRHSKTAYGFIWKYLN